MIKVGDRVKCIKNTGSHASFWLDKSEVYTVSDIDDFIITLYETGAKGYIRSRFRKVECPDEYDVY